MLTRTLKRIATALWGKFESRQELQKFGLLALIFGLLIGVYWAFRPMKDSIFAAIVGIDYQPYAKMLSLVVIVPLIILYGKLIDLFPRHKVFYALTTIYALAALVFCYFFMHPTIGLANTVESSSRIIGWLWYVYVESFGSLLVALFWAFTTDITKPESAERGECMKMLKKLLALAACMMLLVGTPACGGGCSSCGSCDSRPVKRTRVVEEDVVVREERVVNPVRRARVAGRRAARRTVRRGAVAAPAMAEEEAEYETEMMD